MFASTAGDGAGLTHAGAALGNSAETMFAKTGQESVDAKKRFVGPALSPTMHFTPENTHIAGVGG